MRKDYSEISQIRESCNILSKTFEYIYSYIKPNINCSEIDKLIGDYIVSFGASPAFYGYNGFMYNSCISINDEIIHGNPTHRKIIREGDIVSLDMGVEKNGFYSDAAYTFIMGEVPPLLSRLVNVTKESLYLGISQALVGNIINDISNAVYFYVVGNHFDVVREYSGHGIGKKLHENPSIFNFPTDKGNVKLEEGMVLAIEPMVVFGDAALRKLNDGTIVTKSGKPAAHFEHTILIKDEGPEILTNFYDTNEYIIK